MIARWISVVFHPLMMVGLMVSVTAASTQSAGQALRSTAIVLLFTVVPLLALMVWQVRAGAWDNADASNHGERPMLYFVGLFGVVSLLVYFVLLRPQSVLIKGVTATLAMLAVCALATKWVKVSLHMAFGALAASVLATMRSPVGYALVVALPAVAWARLRLERHRPLEVAFGTLIGAAAGIAIHYL